MMKYTVIFATLLVCTFANPLFPHLYGNHQNPNNMDQDDGVYQGAAQQGGVQNQNTDSNEFPMYGGQGANPQAGTTVAPDSSGSSSEETLDTDATQAPAPAGPIFGQNPGGAAPQAGPDAGARRAGQSSDTNTNMISQVDAAPVGAIPDPGNSGQQFDANANPLNMQIPAHQKQAESRQSSVALAGTTLFLVAGVAATAAVTYKYKDAIRGRIGL